MLDQLGIESEFRGGLRVTTPEVMQVVEMVLTGQVQREIVRDINEHGPLAVGMSGEDGGLLNAVRREATVDGALVDVGLVGDIDEVRPEPILSLLDQGLIPVISTVARGSDGETLNVNADTAAGAIAIALGAHKMVMLTDVEGLYRDWPTSDEVIASITANELRDLLPTLASGMVPKMEACLRSVDAGVSRAHVIDGRVRHGPARRGVHRSGRGDHGCSRRGIGMSASTPWQDRWAAVMMSNYGTPAVMLTRGAGSRVWDADGKEYIDLIAGIAVNALGARRPTHGIGTSQSIHNVGSREQLVRVRAGAGVG